ncbi:hypothetical protein RIF29_25389 [Crotalaria pallida]|uniref:Uncharacterized protein n=1 Tax=Crotalaria pallida TaxID=3830 RepID=A0AAN9ENN5_CROPI
MMRKRGRPPKTPSSSTKKTLEKQPVNEEDHCTLDLSLSDEETLETIDNLTPKKVAEMLQNLGTLRDRIKRKMSCEGKIDEDKNPHYQEYIGMRNQNKQGGLDSNVFTKQPS